MNQRDFKINTIFCHSKGSDNSSDCEKIQGYAIRKPILNNSESSQSMVISSYDGYTEEEYGPHVLNSSNFGAYLNPVPKKENIFTGQLNR